MSIKRSLACKIYIGLFALTLFTFLLGLGSGYFWFSDLISHFRLYHLLLFIFLAIWGFSLDNKRTAIGSVGLAICIVLPLVKYYLPSEECVGSESAKIIAINLQSDNEEYAAVTEFISQENPEVFLVTELTEGWLTHLQRLTSEYPFHVFRTREDHFGIGLFSKTPLDTSEIVIFDQLGVPAVRVDLSLGILPVTIVGIHPIPPFWPLRHKLRNDQLKSAIDLAHSTANLDIVLGDFNCTSFAVGYRQALAGSGLKDSRLGHGWQHSWHPSIPGISLAIDHAWVSKALCVVDRRIGSNVGSDHLPVILELSLAQ